MAVLVESEIIHTRVRSMNNLWLNVAVLVGHDLIYNTFQSAQLSSANSFTCSVFRQWPSKNATQHLWWFSSSPPRSHAKEETSNYHSDSDWQRIEQLINNLITPFRVRLHCNLNSGSTRVARVRTELFRWILVEPGSKPTHILMCVEASSTRVDQSMAFT